MLQVKLRCRTQLTVAGLCDLFKKGMWAGCLESVDPRGGWQAVWDRKSWRHRGNSNESKSPNRTKQDVSPEILYQTKTLNDLATSGLKTRVFNTERDEQNRAWCIVNFQSTWRSKP